MIRRTAVGAMAAALALATISPTDARRRNNRRKGGGGVQAAASFDPFSLNTQTYLDQNVSVGTEDVAIVTASNVNDTFTVTLPDPTTNPGRVIFVTVDPPNLFVTVENLASAPCSVVSDGTRWLRLSRQ
jgi:hypothetical protein